MRKSKSLILCAVAAAAVLLSLPSSVRAESGNQFHFYIDPLTVERLWTDIANNSSKLEEYRDLSSGVFVPMLRFGGASTDQRRALEVQFVNAGRDDAFYGLEYDVAGSYRFQLSYDKIPHRFGYDGKMLHNFVAPGRLAIADPIQQALQSTLTNQFALDKSKITYLYLLGLVQPYLNAASPIDLGLIRDRTHAKLDLGKSGTFGWGVDYKNEHRRGYRAYGGAFGFGNVTEIPEPIDYDTTDATVSMKWSGGAGLVTAGYKVSEFKNNISTLTWDNPFRITDSSDASAYQAPGTGSIGGAVTAQADLAPDNKANSLFANGRFKVGGQGWIQAAFALTRTEQNDRLLPFTTNTSINTSLSSALRPPFDATNVANLPFATANREAETTKFVLAYGTRFAESWQLDLKYDYLDYADSSRKWVSPGYVRYHGVWEQIGRQTVPFDWTKTATSAEISKDFDRGGELGVYYRMIAFDREDREVETTDEDIIGLTYDVRVGPAIVRALYETADRTIDGQYHAHAAEDSFTNPGVLTLPESLRRFDQADRQTDKYSLKVDLPIGDRFGLMLAYTGVEFAYDESEFGAVNDEQTGFDIEFSYDAGGGSNFFVFYNSTDRTMFQRGRQSGATVSTSTLDNWDLTLDEANTLVGLGWNFDPSKTWHFELQGQRSKSDGEADFFSPPGGAPDLAFDFDNYEDYEITSFLAKAEYKFAEDFSIGLKAQYEDYTIDSFIRQNVVNYLNASLLLAADDGDYEATLYSVSFKLRR